MKRSLLPYLFLFILIVGIGAMVGGYLGWQWVHSPMDRQNQDVISVIISQGSSASQIGRQLKEQNLIRSPFVFRLYVQTHNWAKDLKPGLYKLSPSQSLTEIAAILEKGVLDDFWVTIPEGKRREEIAYLLSQTFTDQEVSFSVADFMVATQGKEGQLFPDTYLVPKTMTTEGMVTLLQSTFTAHLAQIGLSVSGTNEFSMEEIITLASMVEREAKFVQDRPMVAGVLLNRLKIGMALQIDATVQYAVGEARCGDQLGQACDWWPVISETTFNSLYNTYLHPGLPPGPIANPGLAAIEAVLHPKTHDYLYYLSQPNGTTHYSKTLEEHQRKIEQYLN